MDRFSNVNNVDKDSKLFNKSHASIFSFNFKSHFSNFH